MHRCVPNMNVGAWGKGNTVDDFFEMRAMLFSLSIKLL